jgi:DNA-binding beta-propeller fold protein YncE
MLTTVAAGRAFDYSYCIGMVAMSGAGFTFPVDFAMTPQGVIYVINRAAEGLNQRVSKCTVNHEFLAQFGNPGAADGQFTWPMSIELDRDENVYVCDEYLQRISVFAPDGKFLHKWGTPGSGNGELNGPSGLAFDREENL